MRLSQTESIVLNLAEEHESAALDWYASTSDMGHLYGETDGTADVTVVPTGPRIRVVERISVVNLDAISHTVRVGIERGATRIGIIGVTLSPGDHLEWTKEHGWRSFDSTCTFKVLVGSGGGGGTDPAPTAGTFGYTADWSKVASGTGEAVGLTHFLGRLAGFPGAWAQGTPGLSGRATDGTLAADAGCLPVRTPVGADAYLTGYQAYGSVSDGHVLYDVLWVNSGIGITTLTAQAINSVAWPARDMRGTTEGHGVRIGLLFSAASTNAAMTNTTCTYTNSNNLGSRTATLVTPASVAQHTLLLFDLAAGDQGVRSIQTYTAPTTYVTGTVHLVALREIARAGALVANMPFPAPLRPAEQGGAGVRLYPGVCLLPALQLTATTSATTGGIAYIEER